MTPDKALHKRTTLWLVITAVATAAFFPFLFALIFAIRAQYMAGRGEPLKAESSIRIAKRSFWVILVLCIAFVAGCTVICVKYRI